VKFGVFLPNGSNGYILSKAVKPYLPTFEHNKAITLEAEKQGLDFVLSMMKFRGFGGETGYWDSCLESFTLMAGLAGVTHRIGLIPSIALLSQHPAYVARMIATIDDMSGGRCSLNIVTGWNKPEYTQMGLWRGDEYYERRYDFAADYLSIMQDLWRNGTSTHKSEFFDLKDCSCLPMPKNEIKIVSAGQSPKGVQFVAKNADHNFVMAPTKKLKGISNSVKAQGRENGRDVGTYALYTLITADTDAEAKDIGQNIIDEADTGAISNIIASANLDTNTGGTADHLKAALELPLEDGNMAFMSNPVIHGSYDTVAQKIDSIAAETGIDGMLFSWPDFVGGIKTFGEHIMPLLNCTKT
tara:strand:- start:24 stop:1091 length:1068 start_codon:yes stop_codon:yes gene_type:complete